MLWNYIDTINSKKAFLCSSPKSGTPHKNNLFFLFLESSGRKGLLENNKIKFGILPSDFEENLDKAQFKDPVDYCKATCHGKVEDVMKKIEREKIEYDLLIFADTICVSAGGQIVEKPENWEDAFKMMKMFNNNHHFCTTCVHVVIKTSNGSILEKTFIETSKVFFGDYDDDTLLTYAKSDLPKGKCGGYALQGDGIYLVEKIDGDYTNVVGLPMYKLSRSLVELIKEAGWV